MSSDRAAKLAFAKKRAMDYLNAGNKKDAVTSLMSDFRKWEIYPDGHMSTILLLSAFMNPDVMVDAKFINGFN